MSAYHWHPAEMSDVFILPAGVTEQLKIASKEQLAVLLWFSRHHQSWDETACAADLGMTAEDCRGCLEFWVQQGLLMAADAPVSAPAPAAAPVKAARPAAVKPRLQEVLEYQRQHPDFRDFLEAASATLGKPVSHGDTATLLYLLDTVGLSDRVILLEIAYAVSIGKGNMRYIEKMALNWADEEITTFEAVDAHVRRLEACRKAGDKVEALLQLKVPLTAPQCEMAMRWTEEWHFSDEMLCRAAAITTEKTGKFSPGYMHKILERWHLEGVDTPDKIAAIPTGKKGAAATNPEQTSLDVEGFEQSLLRYRPKFKNTDETNKQGD